MFVLPPISTLFPYFSFNDTATTEIYTLSLHDALPIYPARRDRHQHQPGRQRAGDPRRPAGAEQCRPTSADQLRQPAGPQAPRSEEHTSELQSRQYLVCRLLLEKKTPVTPISRMPSSD